MRSYNIANRMKKKKKKNPTTKLGGKDGEKLELLHTESTDVRCYNQSGN